MAESQVEGFAVDGTPYIRVMGYTTDMDHKDRNGLVVIDVETINRKWSNRGKSNDEISVRFNSIITGKLQGTESETTIFCRQQINAVLVLIRQAYAAAGKTVPV